MNQCGRSGDLNEVVSTCDGSCCGGGCVGGPGGSVLMPWCLVLPVVDGGGGGKPGSDGLLAGSMLLCVIWWIGNVGVLVGVVGMDVGLVQGGC